MEQITDIINKNPGMLGFVFIAVGALIMIGAICGWQWVIGTDVAGNKVKTGLFGWIIYKLFGRRTFFIFTGAVIILVGIGWFVAFSYLS